MEIAVIGAGMGGLASAVELAADGHRVEVFEIAEEPGGKVGVASAGGVAFDTGPSVLTMPAVLDRIFEAAGTSLNRELELVRADPWFRYIYPDGVELEIYHDRQETYESIEETLGSDARDDFEEFLDYAERVWDAAAPNFIFSEAPSFGSVLKMGLRKWQSVRDIDPLRTMQSAIDSIVSDWHLRWLLARYATYVGSDPRQAPATLNCIAWVEMGRGSWGVRGGMYQIPQALERVGRHRGVDFHYETPVHGIDAGGGRVDGIRTAEGPREFDAVVANGSIPHLTEDLLDGRLASAVEASGEPSMSGWTGLVRTERRDLAERRAHTVVFPEDYEREFADIFDRGRPPRDPTLYLCAQEKAHGRSGWPKSEPVFVMANAPPEPTEARPESAWADLRDRAMERLREAELVEADAELVWERTPGELAQRFPGSRGAIYGAASNSRFAAFRRPANEVSDLDGLYLANGGAHPGGGVPMCLQSGRLAAEAVGQ